MDYLQKEFEDSRAYINARISLPEIYDVNHQCTTEAIEVAKRAGIVLPLGKGKLRYAETRVVDSSTPASLLRDLKKRAEADPSTHIVPIDADFFRRHGLRVVEK
jgi:hypothetical protein